LVPRANTTSASGHPSAEAVDDGTGLIGRAAARAPAARMRYAFIAENCNEAKVS
jgi:hypothetical protein